MEVTTMHNHLPTSELKEIMNHREVLKTEAQSGSLNKPRRMIRNANHELSAEVIAKLPSTDASRQAINRIRSSNVDGGVNPTCRENVSISRELQTTFNGMKFLFEDTQDLEKKTYVKMFKLLSYHLDVAPDSINCDFEKGIHSAITTMWPLCQIYGCFFSSIAIVAKKA